MDFCEKRYFLFQNRALGLLLTALVALAHSAPAIPAKVVLVKSTPRTEYERKASEQTSRSISSSLEKSDSALALEEIYFDHDPRGEKQFWNQVIEKKPQLLITVGSSATRSAIYNVKNIPIIFTMVLKKITGVSSNSNSTDVWGVTLAIPVAQQLEIMQEALPAIRRVGLIYSSNSADMYRSAGEVASRKGLRLVASEIASEREIPEALRRITREVDVFWMPPDAVIYEPNNSRFILLECYQNSVPIMAVSKRLAIAGTPLALGFDYEDIGRQTAELALKRLSSRGSSSKSVIQHPRKVLLYINEWVASSLRLNIPRKVIGKAIPVKSRSY